MFKNIASHKVTNIEAHLGSVALLVWAYVATIF